MSVWVKSVISRVYQPLPLFTQVQTFRCVALSDAQGQNAT